MNVRVNEQNSISALVFQIHGLIFSSMDSTVQRRARVGQESPF